MRPINSQNKDAAKHDPVTAQRGVTRVLVIKGVCDFAFVVMLVIISTYTIIGARFDGEFEVVGIDNERAIVGQFMWGAGETDIEIHVFVNNQFAGHTNARCDGDATANANRRCEFQITLPELARGEYEARVFAAPIGASDVKPVMRMLGTPRVFGVDGSAP